jgi:acetolactate synthase small subunit
MEDTKPYKKIKLKVKDSTGAVQRVLQIYSRRDYYLKYCKVVSGEGFKEIRLEFPADYYMYKTVVGHLKKLVDLIEIQHNKIDYEHQEVIEMENLF